MKTSTIPNITEYDNLNPNSVIEQNINNKNTNDCVEENINNIDDKLDNKTEYINSSIDNYNINANNKYILVVEDIISKENNYYTRLICNLVNNLNEEGKEILYFYNYQSLNSNLILNLEYKDKVKFINFEERIDKLQIIKFVNIIIDKYEIEEIVFIDDSIINALDDKCKFLNISKIFITENFSDLKKLNNKFDKILYCSDHITKLNDFVENDKLSLISEKPYIYKFDFEVKNEENIKIIYNCELEYYSLIKIIDDFKQIINYLPNISLTICYSQIIGDEKNCKDISEIIEKGIDKIIFKNNLSYKEIQKEISLSNIGFYYNYENHDNHENFENDDKTKFKIKEYEYFGLDVINKFNVKIIENLKKTLNENNLLFLNNDFFIKIITDKIETTRVYKIDLYSKANSDKKIKIIIDGKELENSNILLNKDWTTINFIDPLKFKNLNNIIIYPANNIEKIKIVDILKTEIIYNYNIYNKEDKKYTVNKTMINLAVVADVFTYTNLNYNFNCDYINANEIDKVDVNKYDILFCESCWFGIDSSWKNEFNNFGVKNFGKKISDLVDKFKKENKKTIFYNKEDPYAFENFKKVSVLFDYILTTDIKCVEKYKELNKECSSFPFIINPVIHNPHNKNLNKKLIGYPGSFYSNFNNRVLSMTNNLDKILALTDIDIYDRQYILNKLVVQCEHLKNYSEKYKFPEKYNKYIYPSFTAEQVNDNVYKKYKFILNFNTIDNSETMCSRRAIELAGCGTNIISDNSIALKKMFGKDIIYFDDITSLADLEKYDDINLNLYYETHMKYTIKNLMSYIYKEVGLNFDFFCKKIIIIKNNNTKLSSDIYAKYKVLLQNNKEIDEISNYHKLYILDEKNYYDSEYIDKFILSNEYTNSDIYITKNKKDYFKSESDNFYTDIYLTNYLNNNNEKIYINNNLKTLYTDVFDYTKYVNFTLNKKINNNNDNNVCIVMCLWKRINNLNLTIQNLENQTFNNIDLYLWNNNNENNPILENIINDSNIKFNIFWYNSPQNIGGIGRFVMVKKLINDNCKYDKVIFIDDDQEFANDSIQILIDNFKPKTTFSWYGKKFYTGRNYNDSWANIFNKDIIQNDDVLDYAGTGFMIIDINIFNHPDFFYFNEKYKFIEDLWMSYFCIKNNYVLYNGKQLKQKIKTFKEDGNSQWKNLINLKNEFLNILRSDGSWNV